MKSEKEKMIAGEIYFSEDPELVADRAFSREQMKIINQELNPSVREQILKETFGQVSNRIYLEPDVRFDYGYNIYVGKNFYGNFDITFLDTCPIRFGDNCMVGPSANFYTATHPLNPIKRNSGLENGAPITIGNNVWIGGNATILAGITLGNNVVVGAGSVVTKSFPDNVVLAGNPATVIQMIEMPEETTDLKQERNKIDALNKQLVDLLEERMKVVTTIAEIKKDKETVILDTVREQEIVDGINHQIKNPEYQTAILETFKEIMKQSKKYQEKKMEG